MKFHVFIMMFLIILNGFFVFDESLNQKTFLEGNNFLKTISDEKQVDIDDTQISTVQNKLDGSDSSTSVLGIFDAFILIVDFVKFLLGFLFAFPSFVLVSSLGVQTKFFLFVPMFFMYMYSVLSWIRTGSD